MPINENENSLWELKLNSAIWVNSNNKSKIKFTTTNLILESIN